MKFLIGLLSCMTFLSCAHQKISSLPSLNDESFGACGCRIWAGEKVFGDSLVLVDDGEKAEFLLNSESHRISSNNLDYFKHRKEQTYVRVDNINQEKITTFWFCLEANSDESDSASVSNHYRVKIGKGPTNYSGYCGC